MNTSERPNVLVVDDREKNLVAVEAVLESLDINLFKAGGGDEALRIMLDLDFAVVLLDVEMPGLDGFETARLIRERPRFRDTPIIFLTAFDRGDSSMQRGYELGAVDYMVKPFQPDILRWKVSVFADIYHKARQEKLLVEERIARAQFEAAARHALLLNDAGSVLSSTMHLNSMLGGLANKLAQEFADHSVFFKRERNGAFIVEVAAGSELHDLSLQRSSDPALRAFENAQVVEALRLSEADFALMDATHHGFIETYGIRSALFIPVRGQEAGVGVLALYRSRNPEFGKNDSLFAEDLAKRIAMAVTNAQLYEASQRANRAKDQFLAVVSHELRTPMTAILGWVHILLNNPLDKEATEKALKTIQRNAKLQTELIADILDFSRIVTGKFSIAFEDVDVQAVVDQAVEAMRPLAEKKRVELVFKTDHQSVPVVGDPKRLQQIVSNLLSNAFKFTPEGGRVEVEVYLENLQSVIRVRDTGAGMKPEFIPMVFEPFLQGDNSSTRSYSGLGLGLAIVRHLVELHGGTISAESAGPDQGSTFTISIPTRQAETKAS